MMRPIGTVVITAGVAVGVLCGCGKGRIGVTAAGSTAFQPFAEKLAEEFASRRPDIAVTVQGGGSAVGIQAALSGAAEIGMADLVTLPAEAKSLTAVVVARDSIAVVVHPSNPVTNLTLEQIRGIFNGGVRSWKDVGGADRPITVVSREAGSGTRSSFEQVVGGISLFREAIVQDSNGTIRETVANDPNAVGYLSHGLLNERIRGVLVEGVASTTENVMGGTYKVARPVYFLFRGPPSNAPKEFLDYVLSADGQKVVRDSGLIPAK